MFRGWGVGLTVTDLGGPSAARPGPPGVVDRPSRLTEVLPVEARSDAEIAVELQRVVAIESRLAAYKAGLVLGLAAHRADADADGRSPIPGTGGFFVDELAVVTNSSARAADRLAFESYVLSERLPAVWAALADGELDVPRARVFIDVLGSSADGVAEAVSVQVLPEAAGLSLGRLRRALIRAAVAVDESFAKERRAEAEKHADVRLHPAADGMAEFTARLPAPLAAACWSTVDELAWMVKNDGDPRPIGQLRVGVLADLILRPWDTSRPPVTAHLTVVAPLPSLGAAAEPGAEPGEVAGLPITAAHVRELLAQLDAVCPGGVQAPTGGTLQVAVTDAAGALLATASRRDLQRIADRGCGDHPAASSCGCAVLEPPPPVDRYVPTPAQRRFVKHRDRTCRQPNCGQRLARVDLDHVIPYPEGPTGCDNLCCLCRRHHRLKTLAPGWRFVLTPDGVLRVTTPSGVTRTTRPPGPSTAWSSGPCPHLLHRRRNRPRSEVRPATSQGERWPTERRVRSALAGLASEHDDPAASAAAAAGPLAVADGSDPPAHAGSLPGSRPLRSDRAAPRAGTRAALTGRGGSRSSWWPRRASLTGGQPAMRSGSD